jgi:hypothetical protein
LKYLLTVRLEFDALDDVAAREAAGSMRDIAGCLDELMGDLSTIAVSARLQRIVANKPPRPLAAWSSEE